MPDPNTLQHIVKQNLVIQAAGAALNGNLFAQITPTVEHTHFLERDRRFEGSPGQILAQLRELGFQTTEEGYRMAQAVLSAVPAMRTLYMGRREAGETPTDTMIAIKDFYNGDPLPWYAFGLPLRDTPSITELATWASNEFVTHWALSPDASVLTNTPGNVFDQLKSADRPRTIIGWSDPIRVALPATVSTTLETFALAPIFDGLIYNDQTLGVSVNGGAVQNLTFPATRAVLTAGGETYNFANGEQLDLRYNQSVTTTSTVFEGFAASLFSGVGETYDFSGAPLTLTIAIDGGLDILITFVALDFAVPSAGLASEVALRINTDFGSPIATVVNVDGTDFVQLDSTLEGTDSLIKVTEGTGANAILKFSTTPISGTGNVANLSAVTAAEIAANAQTLAGQDAVWTVVAGPAPQVTSTRFGTTSEVEVLGSSSANVLSELGLVAGAINGTGFAADAGNATAIEVALVVSAFTGMNFDSTTGRVIFETIAKTTSSSIQFSTGSTALDPLGLDDSLYTGSGTNEDYAELRLMGFTLAVDLLQGSSNPQFVKLSGATHSGINATERANITRNHGWMLDPDNDGRTFSVQMANTALQPGAYGITLETRLAADLFQILVTNQVVTAFNQAAQRHSKIPADYNGIMQIGNLIEGVIRRMGPVELGGSGHFRPLGNPEDPDFDPLLQSALIVPRVDQLDTVALQNGILGVYEISLVVLPSGQRVDLDTTIIASNIPQ